MIVIGSSLKVRPVALIPSKYAIKMPFLLFNNVSQLHSSKLSVITLLAKCDVFSTFTWHFINLKLLRACFSKLLVTLWPN